jgi:hypothetical protein
LFFEANPDVNADRIIGTISANLPVKNREDFHCYQGYCANAAMVWIAIGFFWLKHQSS